MPIVLSWYYLGIKNFHARYIMAPCQWVIDECGSMKTCSIIWREQIQFQSTVCKFSHRYRIDISRYRLIHKWLFSDFIPKKNEKTKFQSNEKSFFEKFRFLVLKFGFGISRKFSNIRKYKIYLKFSLFFGIKSEISQYQQIYYILSYGYINIGDGCWRQNVLVTTLRCWWRFCLGIFQH